MGSGVERRTVARNVVAMRAEPDGDSEQVSQLLLGEEVAIEEARDEWQLAVGPDGYRGWVRANALTVRMGDPGTPVIVASLLAPIAPERDPGGPRITLASFGTVLAACGEEPGGTGTIRVRLPGGSLGRLAADDVQPLHPRPRPDGPSLAATALGLLGIPYLWGGRSAFGYDCSGYVQAVYAFHGVALPRDADLQASWPGLAPVAPDAPRAGDLLFFSGGASRHQRRITHVGLCLGDGRFAHAAGGGMGTIVTPVGSPFYKERLVSAGRLEPHPEVGID